MQNTHGLFSTQQYVNTFLNDMDIEKILIELAILWYLLELYMRRYPEHKISSTLIMIPIAMALAAFSQAIENTDTPCLNSFA